jgi:Saccharopine dehydrogenase and related proteins
VVAVDRARGCPAAVQQDALEVPLGGYDLVVNALPGNVAYKASRRVLEAGLDTIDVSFYAEDPFTLQKLRRRRG